MEELKILQKTFDMMNYAYPALALISKGREIRPVVDIKRCMDVIVGEDYRGQQKVL